MMGESEEGKRSASRQDRSRAAAWEPTGSVEVLASKKHDNVDCSEDKDRFRYFSLIFFPSGFHIIADLLKVDSIKRKLGRQN